MKLVIKVNMCSTWCALKIWRKKKTRPKKQLIYLLKIVEKSFNVLKLTPQPQFLDLKKNHKKWLSLMIIKKLTMNWKPDLHANIVGKPQVYDSLDVYVDVALWFHTDTYLSLYISFIT